MRDARVERYVGQVLTRLTLDRGSRRKVRGDLEAGLEPLIADYGVDEALRRFGSVDEVADAFAEQGYQLRHPVGHSRRLWLAALAAALVLLAAILASQLWHPRSRGRLPAQQTIDFSAIHMVDDRVGWALSGSAVLRTEDGGEHWRNTTPNGYGPETRGAFAFTGSDACWLAVWDKNAEKLRVFRTSDGGKSWEPADVPVKSEGAANYPRSLAAVAAPSGGLSLWLMVEPEHGMNSAPGILFRSEDAGATWSPVAVSSDNTDSLPFAGDISFASPDRGWVVGTQISTTNRKLSRTDDGGATWRGVSLPLPDGLPAGSLDFAAPPQFLSGQSGLLQATFVPDTAKADDFRTVTYFTGDGGGAWTDPVVTNGKPWFLDRQTGFQIVNGAIMKTTDGGRNWTGIKSNISSFVSGAADVQFATANDGWALVHYPTVTFVIKTTDGGSTWTRPGQDGQ